MTLKIYDLLGKEVATIIEKERQMIHVRNEKGDPLPILNGILVHSQEQVG